MLKLLKYNPLSVNKIMQLGFFSARALRFHHVITFMLLTALSFQGLLVNLRIFEQPLWLFCLLFFIPFAPNSTLFTFPVSGLLTYT